MKSLLRRQRVIDFSVMAGLLVASSAVTYALVHHQRTLDFVEVNSLLIRQTQKTMEIVKAEVERLVDETREAAQEREKIRKAVEPLKGLPEAVETLKEAAKADGKP